MLISKQLRRKPAFAMSNNELDISLASSIFATTRGHFSFISSIGGDKTEPSMTKVLTIKLPNLLNFTQIIAVHLDDDDDARIVALCLQTLEAKLVRRKVLGDSVAL